MPLDQSSAFTGAMQPRIPERLRYRPAAAAIWRALMLSVAELRSPPPWAPLSTLDIAARCVVLAALRGDTKALRFVAYRIDGRPKVARVVRSGAETVSHRR